MTESRLTKIPSYTELLSYVPEAETSEGKAWYVAFNSLALRSYIADWPTWFTANRAQFTCAQDNKQWTDAFRLYGKVIGKYTPWFKHAMATVVDIDPSVEKPVLSFFFDAQIDALVSLRVYQKRFSENKAECAEPELYKFIEHKIEADGEQAEPLMFSALAGGYEHSFAFAFKMLKQYRAEFSRMPTVEEFDVLSRQLVPILFKESHMSRKDNAIFEIHFAAADPFFVFEGTGCNIRVNVRHPNEADKANIWNKFQQSMPEQELTMQNSRAVGVHYGCPAAFGRDNAVIFVVKATLAAIRKSLWPNEDMNLEAVLPMERGFRNIVPAFNGQKKMMV